MRDRAGARDRDHRRARAPAARRSPAPPRWSPSRPRAGGTRRSAARFAAKFGAGNRGFAAMNSIAATCSGVGGVSVSSAAPDRREGDQRGAERGAGLHQPELRQPGRQRILRLHRRHRMHRRRPPQRRRRDLREADRPGLAGLDQPGRAPRPPPRSAAPGRAGARRRGRRVSTPSRFRLPSSSASRCAAELSNQRRRRRRLRIAALVAMRNSPLAPGEEAADHRLRPPHAIDVRGVDMVDPERPAPPPARACASASVACP